MMMLVVIWYDNSNSNPCARVTAFVHHHQQHPTVPHLRRLRDRQRHSPQGLQLKPARRTPISVLYASKNLDPKTTTTSSEEDISIIRLDQILNESKPPTSVWKLQQTMQHLQIHPEIQLSRTHWDLIFDEMERVTADAEENTVNLRMEFPIESKARKTMTQMYQLLQQRGDLQLYGAVNTTLPPAAGETQISPALFESIVQLPMSAFTPTPTNSFLLAGVALATLEFLLAIVTGISWNALILVTVLFLLMDRLFLNAAILESFLKVFNPGVQRKILLHEAGHFLAAYVLGCPVEGIVLSSWAALRDRRFGNRQVSAGTSFFDPILSQQINQKQQITRSSIDRYSIIVMAGIAAEAEQFGRADGGAGDELALIGFLRQIADRNVSAPDPIQNQARWGALQAILLLRQYRPAYLALVDALERGGTLKDCIHAIEKATRENNLRQLQLPLGYIRNGQWIAKDEMNSRDDAATLSTETTSSASMGASKVGSATKLTSMENTDVSMVQPEQQLQLLQEYRKQVEEKLRNVEQKLQSYE
jgi:hypothetical protein